MLLRTTAGAQAGQVRNYEAWAAQAALRSGTAERVDTAPARPAAAAAAPIAVPSGEVESQRRDRRHRR